jgi:hypothetical protein
MRIKFVKNILGIVINYKMDETLDIIHLIEKNPIANLSSKSYQSKIVNKIKDTFTDTQQQLFVSSFYCYLNYNTREFIIDLSNVWKWCGFSRKDFAKKLLLKHFEKDIDYKILLQDDISLLQLEEQKDHTDNRGGHNKEKILMTIETFKKFCMKANTKKADEIHDYYIKLEKLIQETVEEESSELRQQLKLEEEKVGEQETKLKEQEEELNKLKKTKNCLYIGHTPIMKDLVKIGITEDLTTRLEQHKSSNPNFEYLFTFKTENAPIIESMVKILLKNYRFRKPEWFSMTYAQIKDITDFCIMMYDTYNINESIENLQSFISKYNKNRLVNSDCARQYFLHSHYEQFINENIIKTNDNTSTPLNMIVKDFDNWVTSNRVPHTKSMYSNSGNLSTAFIKEFKAKIEELIDIKSDYITISDIKRNVNSSKTIGWKGVDLKSIRKNCVFFYKEDYEKFVNENLVITNDSRDKIVGKFLIQDFLNWCKQNKIYSGRKENIQAKGKYSNIFQDEFIQNISNVTNKPFYRQRTYKGVSGVFWYLNIKGNETEKGNNTVVYRQSINNLSNIKKYDKLSDCSKDINIDIKVLALQLKNHKVYEKDDYIYSYQEMNQYNKNDYVNKTLKKIYKQKIDDLSIFKEYKSVTECANDLSIHINTLCKQLKKHPYYERENFIYSYKPVDEYITC